MQLDRPTYGKHRWKPCNDCEYAHSYRFCNFMELTGRSRLVVGAEKFGHPDGGKLLPEGGCRLKKRTKGYAVGNGHLTVDQIDRMFDMYDRGMTDPEIAAEIGCHKNSVLRWRRRNGLEANG